MIQKFIYWVILLNIITHLIIFIINNLKSGNNEPTLFKIFFNLPLYTINIILSILILFIFSINLLTSLLISYLFITLIIFLLHFILDEIFEYRFNKTLNLIIITTLSSIIYFIWGAVI